MHMERVVSTVGECSSFSPEVATGTNSLQALHSDTHETISSSENESRTSSEHWLTCVCLHGRAVLSWVSAGAGKPWPQQREIGCADSHASCRSLLPPSNQSLQLPLGSQEFSTHADS